MNIFYRGKRAENSPKKRRLVTVCAVLALLAALAAGALALGTPAQLTNRFQKAVVSPQITETFARGDTVKRDVAVRNSGNTAAYCRLALAVSWQNDAGQVSGAVPAVGTDYTLNVNAADWFLADDGYYYCKTPVAAGASTPVLVNALEVTAAGPEGCHLVADVVAEMAQADPATAVHELWSAVQVNETSKELEVKTA